MFALITSVVIGVLSIILGILAKDFNVAQLVTYSFAIGASANLPVIIFSIYWKRFNTPGAVAAMLIGTFVTVIFILLCPYIMCYAELYPLYDHELVNFPLIYYVSVSVDS